MKPVSKVRTDTGLTPVQLAVTLVVVDIPPLVAPRHDVVSGPGILEVYLVS